MTSKTTALPGGTALLALHQPVDDALVALLRSDDHDALVRAGRRLLHVLAPGARLELAQEQPDADAPGDKLILLPIGKQAPPWLCARLPPGMSEADFKRRLALVATLLDARDGQLRTLQHLQQNLRRLERAERVQRALYEIAELASSSRGMRAVVRAMHQTIATLMYAENFHIILRTRDDWGIRFIYSNDAGCAETPRINHDYPLQDWHHSLTWYVLTRGRALMGDPEQLAAAVPGPLRVVGPPCAHWLGVPMLRGGHAIGALVVQSYDAARAYSEQDKALLSYMAQHVQTALQRQRAHLELTRQVHERTHLLEQANQELRLQVEQRQRGERLQATLFRIAELAADSAALETFYSNLHAAIDGLLHARNLTIALLADDHQTLTFPYAVDLDAAPGATPPAAAGDELAAHVLRTGKPLLAGPPALRRLHDDGVLHELDTAVHCWLGVPLLMDERTAGVIIVKSLSAEHLYDAQDQDLLTYVAWHVGNALERRRHAESLRQANAELEHRVLARTRALAEANHRLRRQILERERIEQRLKYQTLHDALTGLPNRKLLRQRLRTALAACRADPRQGFAVLFVDLDRFKVINDSEGHMVGDELLFQVGSRIRACIKDEDLVARLGGDEFAVLLRGVTSRAGAEAVANRILAETSRPFDLGSREIYTAASIGIAMAGPGHERAEDLLRDADTAMYRAKAEGRQRHAVFDAGMRAQATTLQEIQNDLRRAVNHGEFEPWFQPIVDLGDDRIVGYEALARWNHPQRGVLSAESFISVAEDSGIIERIDQLMLDMTLARVPQLAIGGRFVSINLSGRHFRAATRVAEHLAARLRKAGVAPGQIRIEVTEGVLLNNPRTVRAMLQQLRDLGVGVALDDFGTGYSSLSYLHQFPLNALKIDQSFVARLTEPHDSSVAIVRAIKDLADARHIEVIAEGIESRAQVAILRDLGCRYGQGFLYSLARPAQEWLPVAAPPQ